MEKSDRGAWRVQSRICQLPTLPAPFLCVCHGHMLCRIDSLPQCEEYKHFSLIGLNRIQVCILPQSLPGPPCTCKSQGRQVCLKDSYALVWATEVFTPLVSRAGGMLGDGLAQLASGEPFDVARNMRMASYGLLIGGPSGHMWHKFLDATVMPHAPKSTRAVLSKLAADQLAFAPLANVALFAFIECTKGTPHQTLFVIQVRSGSVHLTADVCLDGAV